MMAETYKGYGSIITHTMVPFVFSKNPEKLPEQYKEISKMTNDKDTLELMVTKSILSDGLILSIFEPQDDISNSEYIGELLIMVTALNYMKIIGQIKEKSIDIVLPVQNDETLEKYINEIVTFMYSGDINIELIKRLIKISGVETIFIDDNVLFDVIKHLQSHTDTNSFIIETNDEISYLWVDNEIDEFRKEIIKTTLEGFDKEIIRKFDESKTLPDFIRKIGKKV